MANVVQRPRQNRTTASRDGEPGAESVGRRRRGRRPSGQDTRAALLSAALEVFGEQGFAGATVRAIAHRAGVDAAMVNHWFGSKRGLFLAAIQVPFDPQQLVEHAISGDPNTVAERIVRTFVTAWDKHPNRFKAVVQSVTTHDAVAGTIRDLVIGTVVRRTTELLNLDHVEWRASLCASQLLGLGLTGVLAGPRTMPPSESRKVLPCQGHVTQPSAIVPSSSGPPRWVHVAASA